MFQNSNHFQIITISIVLFAVLCACSEREKSELEVQTPPLAIGDTTKIAILTTTDLHGWVLPWDYETDSADPRYGMSKISSILDSIRSVHQHTLLLDAGDWLQGNSFAEYFAKINPDTPGYPLLKAAEAMNYDAFVLGNHEFNFGIDYLNTRIEQTSIPILGANVYKSGTKTPAYTPYIMRSVGGVNVAVIGLTTPGSAVWDRPRVEGILDFGDGLEAADRFVRKVREKGAQFVVVLAHSAMGPGSSYTVSGIPDENFGREILENVPGIDLFVFGHSHRVEDKLTVSAPDGKEVPVIQAGYWASHLGEAVFEITRTDSVTFEVLSTTRNMHLSIDFPSDPAIYQLMDQYHSEVREYINFPLVFTPERWNAVNARSRDHPVVDLIHVVQLGVTGAQISAASAFNTSAVFGPGNISRRDLAMIYPYENMLYKIEITGKQLREYLEFTSRYYEGVGRIGPVINPRVPGFNFDTLAGVEYDLDIRRRYGDRVTRLQYNGRNIAPDDTFTMALNSYRAVGGGGYEMLSDVKVLWQSDISVREYMEQFLMKRDTITFNDVYEYNWNLIWR